MADPALAETPAQTRLRLTALARQREQEAADAEINAAAGITDAPSDFMSAGKEFVRSAGEGFTSIADTPERVWTAAKNLPRRLQNTAADAAEGYTPDVTREQLQANAPAPVALDEPWTPASNAYNDYLPPDPNHPEIRQVGNIVGSALPAIVAPELLAGRLPGVLNTAKTLATTTAGTYGGGNAGEAIDKGLGGDGSTGKFVGSALGGGVSGAVPRAGYRPLNLALTDEQSATRLANARKLDIPESLGLVGNKFAGVVEDAAAGIPFAGGPAYAARRGQYTAMDDAARRIAADTRGAPAGGPIDEASIGQGARDAASAAINDAQHGPYGVDQVFGEGLSENVGRDTILPINRQRLSLDALSRDPLTDQATQAPTINHFRDMLEQNARYPVDPGVEAALQARRAQVTAAQQALPEAQRASLQPSLDMIDDELQRNKGVPWQVGLNQRNYGYRTDSGVSLDAKMRESIRNAQTGTLRDAASEPGVLYDAQGNPVTNRTVVNPVSFDLRNAETARLKTQQDLLQPIVDTPGQGEAYNRLFSTTAKRNLDQLAALQEHAPQPLAQVFADQYERKMRGGGAGLPNASPETLPPTRSLRDWWAGQPQEARDVYAPGPIRERADALAGTVAADARRPTRTIPGAGGNTMSAPATLYQNPAILNAILKMSPGVAGGVGGVFGGLPGALIGAAVPSGVARGIGTAFTSPRFVQNVVHPPPLLQQRDLARLLAGAIAGH